MRKIEHRSQLFRELLVFKWFLEIESISFKDAVQIAEMMTKDFKHYISLLDKAAAGLGKMDSNLEISSAGKMLPNSIASHAAEKLSKEESIGAADFIAG